jgi:hypothetical protein
MSIVTRDEIDPERMYSTTETAKLVNISLKQVARLVDQGHFPGSQRKSPVPGSPREIPGSAILHFLEARKQTE